MSTDGGSGILPIILIRPDLSSPESRRAWKSMRKYPALGLLTIAAVVQSHGYRVLLLDLFTRDEPMPWLVRELLKVGAQRVVVGITVTTENAHDCAHVQRLVRQILPDATIVLGGPHVTVCYEEALASPDTDIVVRGEGESTIIEILESLSHPGFGFSRISGIAYRDSSGAVRCNRDRPPIRALDQLPMPAYELADTQAGAGLFNFVSSRGCPGRCAFCAAHVTCGPLVRSHTAEWMFSMMYAEFRRRPFIFTYILDDTFTTDARRVRRFCALLQRWTVKRPWAIRTRVDVVNRELLQELAAAGCREIHIGVESGDDHVLKSIGKNITLAQIRQAIRLILEQGLQVTASFIFGHPSDTRETIEKTVLLALAMREFGNTGVAISTPFPGTRLHTDAARLGIRMVENDWRRYNLHTPIYEGRDFTVDDLVRAEYHYRSSTFFDAPERLLTDKPHVEFRLQLTEWVREMKQLRQCARLPVSAPVLETMEGAVEFRG